MKSILPTRPTFDNRTMFGEHQPSNSPEGTFGERSGKHEPHWRQLLKNVPKEDLDMMLPGAQIRMSLLDGGKILLPTISGAVIAGIKIF